MLASALAKLVQQSGRNVRMKILGYIY